MIMSKQYHSTLLPHTYHWCVDCVFYFFQSTSDHKILIVSKLTEVLFERLKDFIPMKTIVLTIGANSSSDKVIAVLMTETLSADNVHNQAEIFDTLTLQSIGNSITLEIG